MRPLRVLLFGALAVMFSLSATVGQASAREIRSAGPSVAAAGLPVAPLAASVSVATGAAAIQSPELLRFALQRVATRLVEVSRQLSPTLAERIDSMLQARRGSDQAPQSGSERTGAALMRLGGVAVIGLVVALVVLVTALGPLEGVIKTVEADVSGAFWRGLLVQAVTLPILGAILLALALTVIGLLVVPIALLASSILVAGVSTLGILAVAAVIGRARASGDRARSRAGLLRALLIGYAIVWLPWLAAALLVSVPGLGLATRIVALASTWVLATVGTGAVMRSRGGVRIPDVVPARQAIGARAAAAPDWSTPTPISGVVSAVRLPAAQRSAD